MICDLYAGMCIFNKNTVKKCFIAKCNVIVDSESFRGGLALSKRRYFNSLDEAFETLNQDKFSDYHLFTEVLDRDTILYELDNIFGH
jgi:hypothetical protein